MIGFLLGAAVGAAVVLLNLAGLLYHWNREDRKKENEEDDNLLEDK